MILKILSPLLTAAVIFGEPSAPEESAKAPPPSEESISKIAKYVKEVYKEDYSRKSPEDRKALAKKFFKEGCDPKNDPPSRFVFLSEARDLAAQAGSAQVALLAIKELEEAFDLEAHAMKRSLIETAGKLVRTAEDARALAEAAMEAAQEAVARDDYTLAKKMAAAAAAAAKSAKLPSLAALARTLGTEAAEVEKKYQRAKPSIDLLAKKPGNSPASLEAGKFFCLVKKEWQKGLPLLIKGLDPALFSASEMDWSNPQDPSAQADLADRWWQAGENFTGMEKSSLRLRSGKWYAQCASRLPSVAREKALQRLESLAAEGSGCGYYGAEKPPGLVIARFSGTDLYGWEPISGTWSVAGDQISTSGSENRFLRSSLQASWTRVVFEFRGGNPGLYLSSSRDATGGIGVNLDSTARYNGEIRRAVDMARWNTVQMDFSESAVEVLLNDEPVHNTFISLPAYILVKAHRGELRVRKLVAIGWNPD